MNEMSQTITKETRTPIEVLLQMDENNMVSAKRLYEFLELDPSHYARWCKRNIIDNPIVDENVDYECIRPVGELGGQETVDYLLDVRFAEELCMTCQNEKGRQARSYFRKTEQALVVTTQQYSQLVNRVEQLGKFVEDKLSIVQKSQKEIETTASAALAGVNALNSGMVSEFERPMEWINEVSLEIEKLAQHWGRHDPQLCVQWLIEEIEEYNLAPYKFIEYKRKYIMDNPGTKPTRLTVVASDSQYRAIFTEALHRKLQDYDEEFDEDSSLFSRMIVELGEPEVGGPKEWEPDWSNPAFLAMCDEFDAKRRKDEEAEKLRREAMAKMNSEDLGDFDDIID